MLLTLLGQENLDPEFIKDLWVQGYIFCKGKTGSMETQKVVAAIETAARKNQVIEKGLYRETHALYHAIIEALEGVTRGQVLLGTVLRTVGLSFAVIRGKPYSSEKEGDYIYGFLIC